MTIMCGKETDSLLLKNVTEHKGPWRWYGIAIGFSFIGFVKAENPKAEHPDLKERPDEPPGHGYLEELAGLYRVRTMQWEDAEMRARPDTRTLIEKVQDAQVNAGEQAVMDNLKRMGF